ncbi:SDR family NAD(P)-dependent oxidoreductase [Pallidibacillus pasinlerensis]|uniref:SDR family oxidoreductase n=1 Tax=Pallidibacillus pasinlerensis TaxID=2703818 RepID=A0ABX0A141_9BACI|nr:SDR family oxidoreductase [Pallidibacillus pasinlerensis]
MGRWQLLQGAAGGQGAAEARLFAKEGAKVVATDFNYELLEQTIKSINDEIGSEGVLGLKHNVASEEDWETVVSETVNRFGKVDILINNAGILGSLSTDITGYSREDFEKVMEVNTTGKFLGIRAAVPEMKKNGGSSIVILPFEHDFKKHFIPINQLHN